MSVSKSFLDDDDDKISASLVCWNVEWQRPVTPCSELYDQIGYDRAPALASRQRSQYTSILTRPDVFRSTSRQSSDNITYFVNPCPEGAPANLSREKVAPKILDVVNPPTEEKTRKVQKAKDPKAHLSLLSLDNIHTASILCWRRGRKAYLATSEAKVHGEDDDTDDNWHITESVLFILYRFVGYFVLIAQFTFLWSLLDLYASDFLDSDSKRKPFPIKYTASMTERDFGLGPLNATIAAWDAARSASNVRQCQAWILECGSRWNSGMGCEREADISSNCPPWDYEKYLQGRNGSRPICYRSEGAAVLGGSPNYGSMTKGVLQEWAFGFVNPIRDRVTRRGGHSF
jgi:hypothetical protein